MILWYIIQPISLYKSNVKWQGWKQLDHIPYDQTSEQSESYNEYTKTTRNPQSYGTDKKVSNLNIAK
jgi:hypothetical protein